MRQDDFIWYNKYKPRTIQECILPKHVKQIFQEYIDAKEFPHLMLFGKPGIGKSLSSMILCNSIGATVKYINASTSGIDEIRDSVVQFCSTMGFDNSLKVVILEECDSSRFKSGFEALRPILDNLSKNSRFILTGNNISNVPEPIVSRCTTIDFTIPKNEAPKLASQVLKRLKFILDSENVSYDDKVLVELIMKHYPNNRKIIGELQKFASSGTIDIGILSNFSNDSFQSLIAMIKDKRFTDARAWVNDNSDIEPGFFFKTLYENCSKQLEPSSIPEMVLILAKYQYQSSFSIDQEINTTAAIVELMSSVRFK
jgi:DNA polymerase III delta prime subunit